MLRGEPETGCLRRMVLLVAVLALLTVAEKGAAHFGVPFNEPDKWYLRDERPTEVCDASAQEDPIHLVFYGGATKERTDQEIIWHMPAFDTSHSGGDKCFYDHGDWK
jgi:hypothetical protein